jgi:hypothetical protein
VDHFTMAAVLHQHLDVLTGLVDGTRD